MKKKPSVLVIGEDDFLIKTYDWPEFFCEVFPSSSHENAEKILAEKKMDIIVLDGNLKERAVAYRFKYPNVMVILMTTDSKLVCRDPGIHCIQRTEEKSAVISFVMNLWHLKQCDDERLKRISRLTKPLTLLKREPQKNLEAFHLELDRDPRVSLEAVALKHLDNWDQVNWCLKIQSRCRAGCLFCATAKVNQPEINFLPDEYLAQVAYLSTSYKSFGFLSKKKTIAFHGGGDPRYCIDYFCGGIELIEKKLKLNARYIATSIGGKKVFEELIKRLGDKYDMIFEMSGNFADDKRSIYMPATKGDSLQEIVDVLANDAEKTGRDNRYRHMLIGGLNDTQEEADRIAELLKGTKLRVIITKMEPGCLAGFSKVLTEEDARRFVAMLVKRGIKANYNEDVGEGPVKCGKHLSILDR